MFQEMDARKREEAREAALVGGAAPMDEDAPPPVPEEGAMDEDAAPADADADAPPPVPEEGDGAAPAEPEAAAAPPPAPETDERPWETLPSLDTETLESADKEQIKYDIAVLEEERDRLKKICNLDTIRQYREKGVRVPGATHGAREGDGREEHLSGEARGLAEEKIR